MKTFYFDRQPGLWCVVIGSLAMHAKDTRRHRLYFSERNGYGPRLWRIGPWVVSVWKVRRPRTTPSLRVVEREGR